MVLQILFLMFPSMLVILAAVVVLDGLFFHPRHLFWSAGFRLFSDLWLTFEDFPENSLVNLTLVGSEGHVNFTLWRSTYGLGLEWMISLSHKWATWRTRIQRATKNIIRFMLHNLCPSEIISGNAGLSYLTEETLALSLKSLSMVTWSWVWTWTTFELDPEWPKTRLKNPVFFFAILSIFYLTQIFFLS